MLKTIVLGFSLLVMALANVQANAQAPAEKSNTEMIAEIAALWTGTFDNHRQIAFNATWGGPKAPELSEETREMNVWRVDMPELGDTVLFFEEYRATEPGTAHRQRVTSLVWDEKYQQIRALQYFFVSGPGYARPKLDPADVAQMGRADFQHVSTCDLFFHWDAENGRYQGSMHPYACTYDHVLSGMVFAEFDMLLYPDQLWYRDRSIKLSDNKVRGSIDGFSYLRFDRKGD